MRCLLIYFKELGGKLHPPMKKECKMMHSREDNNEGRIISATTVEKMGMVCISAHTQEDILEMVKEEVLEDK